MKLFLNTRGSYREIEGDLKIAEAFEGCNQYKNQAFSSTTKGSPQSVMSNYLQCHREIDGRSRHQGRGTKNLPIMLPWHEAK